MELSKFCTIIIAALLVPRLVLGAMVYSEDFEDNNAYDTFGSNYLDYWNDLTGCTEVVSSGSHGGTYSYRGSISETGALDNISGEPGCANSHSTMGFGAATYGATNSFDLSTMTGSEFYLSWWHKFDYGEISNLLSDSHKIIYIFTTVPNNYLILHMYDSGGIGLIVNADNGAGYPYTAGDNPSNNYQYGYNLGSYPDDGNWHHFEIYMQYGTGGGSNTTIKLWLDDSELLNVTDAVAIYSTGDRVSTVSLPSNISAAGTSVTTVGWQVDDIEIWDGLPDEEEPTPQPTTQASGNFSMHGN